uniref:Secreted protein n=1 Tax=Panagrolaimus sp. PS1159 TaxID=55785 RepID=A0AC35EU02_9BILA
MLDNFKICFNSIILIFLIPLLSPQRYYTCTAENTKLRDYKFGSQFVLNVVKNKRRSLTESVGIPPSEQYVNQSSPIALLGQTHKLHCFFAA